MYLVYSVVPHFTSQKLGPIKPRQTGHSYSRTLAEKVAEMHQGFALNINQNIDGTWR